MSDAEEDRPWWQAPKIGPPPAAPREPCTEEHSGECEMLCCDPPVYIWPCGCREQVQLINDNDDYDDL